MKNKSLKRGLTYFFGQQMHGKDTSSNMLKSVKPESERERTESVIEDILRWADDGGQMILDVGNPSDSAVLSASGGHHGQ